MEHQDRMQSNTTRSSSLISTDEFAVALQQQTENNLPVSNISLPNQQSKVASVLDNTSGLQSLSCTTPTNTSGMIPKHKTNHTFGAIR